MGWMPLSLTASRCAKLVVSKHKLKERASMGEVTIIGVDLAKNVFQVHGAAADGSVRVPQEAVTAAVRAVHGGQPPWYSNSAFAAMLASISRWRAMRASQSGASASCAALGQPWGASHGISHSMKPLRRGHFAGGKLHLTTGREVDLRRLPGRRFPPRRGLDGRRGWRSGRRWRPRPRAGALSQITSISALLAMDFSVMCGTRS